MTEALARGSEPMQAVQDVKGWIAETETLKAAFGRWLEAREAAP